MPRKPEIKPEWNGKKLLEAWNAVSDQITQEKHAESIGLPFTAYKSRIWRAQTKYEPLPDATPFADKKREYAPVYLDAAVFDIECTDFKTGGNSRFMVCASVLPLHNDEIITHRLEFSECRKDMRLLDDLIAELCKYDILIGHNIIAFDFNWINSRLMYHNMPPMPMRWLYYDTYFASKRMAIRAERKSLGFLADFFGLDGEKTSVLPVSWDRVSSPDYSEFTAGMRDIVYHCEQDVFLNRQLFYALWCRDRSMINLPFTKKW